MIALPGIVGMSSLDLTSVLERNYFQSYKLIPRYSVPKRRGRSKMKQ